MVGLGRDDRQDVTQEQRLAHGVAVIAFGGQHRLWRGHRHIDQRGHGSVIGYFPSCQHEAERASLTIAAGVDLARKAAAASTNAFLAGPPLALAA